MGKNNNPIQTRNYEFTGNNSETITFQEHSLGHTKSNPGDPASKPHFNIRDSNLDTDMLMVLTDTIIFSKKYEYNRNNK